MVVSTAHENPSHSTATDGLRTAGDDALAITSRRRGKHNLVTLRPTPAAMGGALALSLVFVVLLPFLVVISFVGQKLWSSDPLFHDHVYTVPAYIWIGIVALCAVAILRIATQRVIISETGVKVRGLFRIPSSATWDSIQGIWVVRDVFRGKEPPDPVEHELDANEACIVMGAPGERIANISGMFYGGRAQELLLDTAREHGVRIEALDYARPSELNHMLPGSQTFLDRHPGLVAAGIVLCYAAHNVVTFMLWGL